jgi:hypothetical protein
MQSRPRGLFRLIATLLLAASAPAQESGAPFQLVALPGPGRTAFAEIADLDGDGRGDLVTASFSKLPPNQLRKLRVHYQREDGGFQEAPDWVAPLPDGSAAYDFLATPNGATEMLFLRRDRVTVLSLAGRTPAWRDLTLPGITLAVSPDERGMDRLRMAREGLASAPLLVVPGLGEIFVAGLDGAGVARLATQSRANFFVPPRPGLLLTDNEADLYLEHPRIDVGEVDGDGRGDLVVANRHEVLVFLGRGMGRFPAQPDQRHALKVLSENDLVRATGNARVGVRDFSGDGRADLLVSVTQGGLLRAHTLTRLHLNRGGTWNVQKPDQTFELDGGWTATDFLDFDADGKLDFFEVTLSSRLLDLVAILLTRSIDPELRVYRAAQETPFDPRPVYTRSLDLGISFETQRTVGFLPSLQDLNGDGRLDLIAPYDGSLLEIHLGAPGPALEARAIRQPFDTTGVIRFGDLDRDGLLDFVIHDPRRPSTPIRVGVNRGALPGTRRPAELLPSPRNGESSP